jgi:predicted nucleotidyltransferase
MESRKDLISKLLNKYGTDEQALGVVQVGSTVKGYADEHSDLDLEVVVTQEKYSDLSRHSKKIIHTEKYDLIFTTTEKLCEIKNSKKDEDHWNFHDSIVLLDKTGVLQKVLNEIIEYDEASRVDRLKQYYGAYWENSLSSWSCLEHGNHWGTRIYVALSAQELIRLLFNFNHHWAPKCSGLLRRFDCFGKSQRDLQRN